MNQLQFDVVALGEAMVEFNQSDPSAPQQFLQGFGGDTSNAIVAAARQGARTAYITRLGDDAFGKMLLALWHEEGVSTEGVAIDPGASTGLYVVTHGDKGHEFSYARAGSAASRMQPEQLPLSIIRSARFVHVSGISQAISPSATDTVRAAIECARAAQVQVAYDPNVRLRLWSADRAKTVVTATLPLCNWFLPSLEDVQWLSGLTEPSALLDWCHAHGAPQVLLKMGGDGVWLSVAGGQRQRWPAHPVKVVDATGAGDCFDGAFLARLAQGDAVEQALVYANAAAALTTQGFGAVAPLPTPPAVRALLAKAAGHA
jgi:2-dehydro-3-deoxygluconokinase